MILYLDTSALVKLYVNEDDTETVRRQVNVASQVAASRVAYPEARAALARRQRENTLSRIGYRKAINALDEDVPTLVIVELAVSTARLAGQLAEQHALRGFDAIHLASAVELAAMFGDFPTFGCFDDRLNDAARAVGLPLMPRTADSNLSANRRTKTPRPQ